MMITQETYQTVMDDRKELIMDVADLVKQRNDLVGALEKVRNELDACQKVIWLASDYGFDPSYVNGAKSAIKVADIAIASVKESK